MELELQDGMEFHREFWDPELDFEFDFHSALRELDL